MHRVVKISTLIITAFILSLPIAAPAATGVINGKVTHGGDPVAGAGVYAVKNPESIFSEDCGSPLAVTDADGVFKLELNKGYHYLAAIKRVNSEGGALVPGDMYSFYGGNPVAVDPARPVQLTLNVVEKPTLGADEAIDGNFGGVRGVVTFEDEPLDGVTIYVYLDAKDSFRGMGYLMSPPTGVDGAFRLRMSEGTYYILARKRMRGGVAGPLREGDYFGYLDINPVVVRKGVMEEVELPVVRKVERASPGGQGRTLVKGFIRDPEGNPVPSVYACIYKNSDMQDRPAFLSAPTGPDGAFTVELPLGGTFYLGARDTIGGPLEPGQLYGRYNGNPEHVVEVETGRTVEGLVVVVEKTE